MEIKCKFKYKIFEKEQFKICSYHVPNYELLYRPDTSTSANFTAKGYCLPESKSTDVILTGEWSSRKNKEGKNDYTFNVTSFEEVKPSEKEGLLIYLESLDGVGKTTAKRMFDEYGFEIYDIIENNIEGLVKIKGISKKKAIKINTSYISKQGARELFQFLYRYGVKDSKIMKIYQEYKGEALDIIKKNPYIILGISGIGFYTADAIANACNLPKNDKNRIEASIIEVLKQSENGGKLFFKGLKYPAFCYKSFLREDLFNKLYEENFSTTGNTYLPKDLLYLLTLTLLDFPLPEDDFNKVIIAMHKEYKLFITRTKEDKEIKVYRRNTAKVEFGTAKLISELMEKHAPKIADIDLKIRDSENTLNVKLSNEQKLAVKTCLENSVSIITGGPGTGKTAVQNVLLSVYRNAHPNRNIVLAAPTGMAAKRMSESTGYPASTLHQALGLYGGETLVSHFEDQDFKLDAGLIIIDESSMIDIFLMNVLLEHINPGTQLIIVGDVDQLPSIGAGCVLKELINSQAIPTVRLTKVFRQADGSTVAVNASRIKIGETDLLMESDFIFDAESTSEEIVKSIKKIYPKMVSEYGLDNVVVLTSYRKSTITGVNNLNPVLRELINPDIENTNFVEIAKTRYYVGDKVMFTKNANGLTNGDVGVITEAKNNNDSKYVEVDFGNGFVETFEDDEITLLDLAYVTTVHKSQGSEYKLVIMICDKAHQRMSKRNLIYTGITRAKQRIILIGEYESFKKGILTEDSSQRYSLLGTLLSKKVESNEQKDNNLASKKENSNSFEQMQIKIAI